MWNFNGMNFECECECVETSFWIFRSSDAYTYSVHSIFRSVSNESAVHWPEPFSRGAYRKQLAIDESFGMAKFNHG